MAHRNPAPEDWQRNPAPEDWEGDHTPENGRRNPAPGGWPRGVTPISVEQLGNLGLDAKNRIYWDGKQIEVRNHLDLTRLQKTLAIIVSVCAVLGAVGGFVTGLNNAAAFLCARDVHWLGCPPGR